MIGHGLLQPFGFTSHPFTLIDTSHLEERIELFVRRLELYELDSSESRHHTEVQIYEKCPNITKDKIAKMYIILIVSSKDLKH